MIAEATVERRDNTLKTRLDDDANGTYFRAVNLENMSSSISPSRLKLSYERMDAVSAGNFKDLTFSCAAAKLFDDKTAENRRHIMQAKAS